MISPVWRLGLPASKIPFKKQHVRVYSYFQDPATFPGLYDPYTAGYTNTSSIIAGFGVVQNEGAAGS